MRTTRSFEKQAVESVENYTFVNVIRNDKLQSLDVLSSY
jgi:hypothetical protein